MTANNSYDEIIADPLGRTDVQIGFEVAIAVLISLISFIGNSLVVYAIHRDRRLNTITNMLIENLAFSDILMATLHMPFWIISLRYGKWIFGHVVCQMVGVTQLIFGIVSLLTMTGIAINRYFKVVKRKLYIKFFSNRKATTVRESARRVHGHAALPNATKTEDKTEYKVLKTSLVVVCVYMICWTPLSVIGFIEVFGSRSPRILYYLAYVLVYCSSMANPFIYGIMNPQFKNAFACILHIRDSTASEAERVSVSRNMASNVDLAVTYISTTQAYAVTV
ncbi:Melanopsin [Stylophora pistillata]|uniref:Melanopsin n=1 Tax=Stylophora pistillata TaxID=50429 RepID=A0A2B4RVY2_STYPI|nr:Melanopsin [Stylophora pistillata]